jgi:hypothetical protein
VGHGVAEVSHPSPNDKAAEGCRGKRNPDPGDDRPREKIIEH